MDDERQDHVADDAESHAGPASVARGHPYRRRCEPPRPVVPGGGSGASHRAIRARRCRPATPSPGPGVPVWRGAEPPMAPGWPPPGGPCPSSGPARSRVAGPACAARHRRPPPKRARAGVRGWIVVAVVAALIGGAAGAGIAEAVGTGNGDGLGAGGEGGRGDAGPGAGRWGPDPHHREERPARGGVDRRQGPGVGRRVACPSAVARAEDQGTGMIIDSSRRGHHQQPRHLGRHDDHRHPVRADHGAARHLGGGGPLERRRPAQDQLPARQPPGRHLRGLDQARGR